MHCTCSPQARLSAKDLPDEIQALKMLFYDGLYPIVLLWHEILHKVGSSDMIIML